MNRALFSGMTLAGLACLLPNVASSQEYIAGPPINCTITRPRPVVTTQMQARQVTSYCDVAETRMTQQRIVENVPVTTCKTVTADEGGYQMVWVPKPVTRQVAETTIQQQVKTVNVPVQVVRRVPQVSTQFVPVQSVQYVNETVPLQMTAMASTCPTCNSGPAFGSVVVGTAVGLVPQPYPFAPSTTTAMVPSMPAITVPSNRSTISPTPRQQADSGWETVRARSASAAPSYDSGASREVPKPRDETIVPARSSSKFSGVPSAAQVWKAQGGASR